MAALSDPRAFMGAAKERTDNMKQMGIEESGPDKKVTIEEKKEGQFDNKILVPPHLSSILLQ